MTIALTDHQTPSPEIAHKWLYTMLLIRRFEEKAGEMYTQAKIGGFLHLSIGEEGTIVGAVKALAQQDYLVSTYREHGQLLAKGGDPKKIMAELFGREAGYSRGRGGSMHLFDLEQRFMGGYGIVGGNLPIAAGIAFKSKYRNTDECTLCMLGDGATNQGTFGETMNIAALWKLPIVFLIVNNQFGMGTALERHSAVTDLARKGESFGVEGMLCNGMDVIDTNKVVSSALKIARLEKRPILIEAVTYRFRGHSMADPEQYRTKEQLAKWKENDPIKKFASRLIQESKLDEEQLKKLDEKASQTVQMSVEFADAAPFPKAESLYDNVYVLGDQLKGYYSIDTRSEELEQGNERALSSTDEKTYREAFDSKKNESEAKPAKDLPRWA